MMRFGQSCAVLAALACLIAFPATVGYPILASPNGPLLLLPALRKVPYASTDRVSAGPNDWSHLMARWPNTRIG